MVDATDATFQNAVVERSGTVPVVVDLWAPWCGPCRTLTPILEDAIGDTDGKVELAKVNVDDNPEVSAAFQVQSIPAVYALRDGEVVDGFIGAQPEAVVREFVQRLLPTRADELSSAGDEDSLRAALAERPDHPEAVPALAALLIERGDFEEALEILARVPESAETRALAARARVGKNGPIPSSTEVMARLDELLDRVKADESARQEFVDLLEVLGPEDERTAQYRRALTARLF